MLTETSTDNRCTPVCVYEEARGNHPKNMTLPFDTVLIIDARHVRLKNK